MLNSIAETEQQKDSLLEDILEKLDIDETGTKATAEEKAAAKAAAKESIKTEIIELVPPLVPVEWSQGEPFNNNLKDKGCYGKGTAENGKVWAGCVAVATAHNR
jgi:hypothetical protein